VTSHRPHSRRVSAQQSVVSQDDSNISAADDDSDDVRPPSGRDTKQKKSKHASFHGDEMTVSKSRGGRKSFDVQRTRLTAGHETGAAVVDGSGLLSVSANNAEVLSVTVVYYVRLLAGCF